MIYVLFGDGFEEVEALAPVDLLRRADLEVKLTGVAGLTATGSHGIRVQMDITLDQVCRELEEGGALDRACLVSNCGLEGEVVCRDLRQLSGQPGYYTTIIVKE